MGPLGIEPNSPLCESGVLAVRLRTLNYFLGNSFKILSKIFELAIQLFSV